MSPTIPFPEARRTIWTYVKHYCYGLFAKSFNGGISAVDAGIGLAVGSVVSNTVQVPNWQMLASVFLVSFGRSALMYFRDHPIPEKLPDTTTTETVTVHTTTP